MEIYYHYQEDRHMLLMWQHNAGIWCTRSLGKKGTNGQRSEWVKQKVGVDTFWATAIPNIFFSRASWIVKLLDNGRRRFRCPSCEKLKSGWVSLTIWKFFNPRDVRHSFSLVPLFHFFNSNLVPWSTFLTFPIKLYQMVSCWKQLQVPSICHFSSIFLHFSGGFNLVLGFPRPRAPSTGASWIGQWDPSPRGASAEWCESPRCGGYPNSWCWIDICWMIWYLYFGKAPSTNFVDDVSE